MINVCKGDLENIGLEITTMNSADVVDHRLDGVDEPDLYIALLKRVQTANAQTRVDVEQAQRDAAAQVADLKQQVLSEKQGIEMLRTKFSKQRSTPAIAETLQFFPVERLSVVTGAERLRGPISAIHPNAVDLERNNLIGGVLAEALKQVERGDDNARRGTPKTAGAVRQGQPVERV